MPATAVYPAALVSTAELPTTIDGTQPGDGSGTAPARAAQQERVNAEMIALQAELGADVAGTFVDLATRQDARLTCRKSADQAFASATPASVTDMSFPVASGQDYMFKFYVPFTTASSTSVGFGLSVSCPALTGYIVYGVAVFGFAADAAAATWFGVGRSSNDDVTSTAEGVGASVVSFAKVEGILSNPSASGTLQLNARSETTTSVTVRRGGFGEIYLN